METSGRWPRRLEVIVLLAVFILVALGAKDVTRQVRRRPQSWARIRNAVRPWCEQICEEVSPEARIGLRRIARSHPEWLLQAGARRLDARRRAGCLLR